MAESSRFSPLARALIGGACFVILVTGMRAAADLFYGLHPSDWLFFLLIPPTLLALLQYGPKEALIVVVGYNLTKGVVFSVLKPIIAGRKLNLSRLVITVSVVSWVWVLGPIGAMLALPLTLSVKEILPETSDEGRPLAAILLIPSVISSLSTVLQVSWAAKINDDLGWLENALEVVQEQNR